MSKTTGAPESSVRHGAERAAPRTNAPDQITSALEFLRDCRDRRFPTATITGASGTGKSMLMHRFRRDTDDGHIVHLTTPTDSPLIFLEQLLAQFGLDASDSTESELRNLTNVVLRHEFRKGLRPVIVVEDIDNFGPRIQATLRSLAMPEQPGGPVALIVVTQTSMDPELTAPPFDRIFSLDTPSRTTEIGSIEIRYRDRSVGHRTIDKAKLVVGRHANNEVCLDDAFVSRYHALLTTEDDGQYVIDLRSTNGTFVNGKRTHRRRLHPGDIIDIGNFKLCCIESTDEAANPVARPSAPESSDPVIMHSAFDRLLGRSA